MLALAEGDARKFNACIMHRHRRVFETPSGNKTIPTMGIYPHRSSARSCVCRAYHSRTVPVRTYVVEIPRDFFPRGARFGKRESCFKRAIPRGTTGPSMLRRTWNHSRNNAEEGTRRRASRCPPSSGRAQRGVFRCNAFAACSCISVFAEENVWFARSCLVWKRRRRLPPSSVSTVINRNSCLERFQHRKSEVRERSPIRAGRTDVGA